MSAGQVGNRKTDYLVLLPGLGELGEVGEGEACLWCLLGGWVGGSWWSYVKDAGTRRTWAESGQGRGCT